MHCIQRYIRRRIHFSRRQRRIDSKEILQELTEVYPDSLIPLIRFQLVKTQVTVGNVVINIREEGGVIHFDWDEGMMEITILDLTASDRDWKKLSRGSAYFLGYFDLEAAEPGHGIYRILKNRFSCKNFAYRIDYWGSLANFRPIDAVFQILRA
ncbi:MAG: hypothetical protein CMM93_06030 [Rickettsiales bacterium]|nr:hypothetical protein [Rickettsiales bacterium]|tara:strand:+ start:84 stop:545 length:462 start_codon:yes stop_codon:yes gene_type:complete